MAKGISIGIAADTKDALKGIKTGVIEPLEDASDVLEDLAKDSEKTGDKLEDSMRDAQKRTEQTGDEYKKLGDTIRETGRRGGDFGKSVKDGTDQAKEGVSELKDEANSTAREAAASFDGSAESIGSAFQEVAANAFAGFGPAGAAAGLLVAAGIGIGIEAINQGAEDTAAFKERVSELATQFIETGRAGEVNLDFVVDKLKELATASEDGEVSLKDLKAAADRSGGSFEDLARVYTGNVDGIDEMINKSRTLRDRLEDQTTSTDTSTDAGTRSYNRMLDQILGLDQYISYLEAGKKATEEATAAEQNYADAGGYAMEARAAAGEEYATSIQDSLNEAGEAWEEYTDNGIINLDRYNEEIEKQAQAVQQYQANMVTASQTLSEEALNYIASLGEDAAPLLQAYVDAPLQQKERTAGNWGVLGKAASNQYVNDLKAGIPTSITGPAVVVPGIDFSQAERDIRNFVGQRRVASIEALIYDRNGRPVN